jgi:3-oxoacyl-[acyl-carrier-protein] synthase I
MQSLEILGVGMVSPIGFCAQQAAATLRAGIGRVEASYVFDQHGEQVNMGMVATEELPPSVVALGEPTLSAHAMHLLRMAGTALAEAGAAHAEPMPLLLALGDSTLSDLEPRDLFEKLALQSGVALDVDHSRVLRCGRSGGLTALAHARALLAQRSGPVLIGGLDSYLDHARLRALEQDGRLATLTSHDGLVPGEGAAFVLLGSAGAGARLGSQPIAKVLGHAQAEEPGHLRAPSVPHRGDGLATACRAAVSEAYAADVPSQPAIRSVMSGLTGESFWSKEWGVTRIRLADQICEPVRIEHPIELMGDPGAALSPMLLTLGALWLESGILESDCLVWCGSDGPERAAAVLTR